VSADPEGNYRKPNRRPDSPSPWRSYCRQHGETCTVVKTASTVDVFSSLLCKKLCHFTLLGHGGTQRTLTFSDEIRMGSGADAVGACCWRAWKARAWEIVRSPTELGQND